MVEAMRAKFGEGCQKFDRSQEMLGVLVGG